MSFGETRPRLSYYKLAFGVSSVAFTILTCVVPTTLAFSDDVTEQFARFEKARLAKCFSNTLTVVKRHNLGKYLPNFLETVCALERDRYVAALGAALGPGVLSSRDYVRPMMGIVIEHYRNTPVSICSGDACALDAYRKCLFLQMSPEMAKRAQPLEYERASKNRCDPIEDATRAALIIDFGNSQMLQMEQKLDGRTRDIINEVIIDVRHDAVIAYAEELTKLQPERESCRPKRCEGTCFAYAAPDAEYKCAIENSRH